MRTIYFFLIAFIQIICSDAVFAQKAFMGGFGNMVVVNPTTLSVSSTICCGDKVYLAPSADSSILFTSNWNSKIYYINPVSEEVTDSINLQVYDISNGDYSNKLFAALKSNNQVYIIDPATKSYDSAAVNSPNMLTKRPGKKEIWIANDNQYSVLDYSAGYNVVSHTFATGGTFVRDEIRFSPDGNTALLTHGFGEKIYKIDANAQTITDSIQLNAWGVEFNGDGSRFYAGTISQKIFIYNTMTMEKVDSIATPHIPFSLFLTPDASQLWAVYHNEDSLGVFNASTLSHIATIKISPSPFYIVFLKHTSTGIEQATGKEEMNVYPNPAGNRIFLTESYDEVILYDAEGGQAAAFYHENSWGISHLKPGLYMILAKKGDRIFTSRVIKE